MARANIRNFLLAPAMFLHATDIALHMALYGCGLSFMFCWSNGEIAMVLFVLAAEKNKTKSTCEGTLEGTHPPVLVS